MEYCMMFRDYVCLYCDWCMCIYCNFNYDVINEMLGILCGDEL